jgi:hypothetical protein
LEPLGDNAMDRRFGMVLAAIANAMRGKGSRVAKPEDFFPWLKNGQIKRMTAAQIRERIKMIFGGA